MNAPSQVQLELDMRAATLRADLGAERAAAKASRLDPTWLVEAVEEVRDFARGTAGEFTIEQARSSSRPLPAGADARAWGHVTRRALALRIIEPTGGYAKAASSNGSPKPLYRRGSGA